MIETAIAAFRRRHGGTSPREIVVSQEAATILALQERLPPVFDGIPISFRLKEPMILAAPGKGNSIGLVMSNDKLERCLVEAVEIQ